MSFLVLTLLLLQILLLKTLSNILSLPGRPLHFCYRSKFFKTTGKMTDLPDIRHLQTQSTDHHWRPSAEHPKEENRDIQEAW